MSSLLDLFCGAGGAAVETVQEIDETCDECTVGPPTHIVMLDLRSAGESHVLGRFCHQCAVVRADRVRDGLPDA